jgi:predicted DNA-binding protein
VESPDAIALVPDANVSPAPGGGAGAAEASPSRQRAERSRGGARRVQTSVSLPPDLWDSLDELASGAGVSVGELLTTILTGALPETPEVAFAALEQLLVSIAPGEGLQEERNFRLPLELRTSLDELARALGPGPRLQRSLLIRAIVGSRTPSSSEHARELITTRRIAAMRSTMLASATD